jgi:hypothetical protein
VRRSPIPLATSMCLAALLIVAGSDSAFGAHTRSAAGSSAIPTGFHAQSQSWVSPKHGRLLGSAPCGQTTCTTVVGTTDGGATWNTLGTVEAPLTLEQASGVTEVRFADDLHGWAFEPALYGTSDGGVTWQRQAPPGGAHLVLTVAGNSRGVYALVSPCRLNRLCHDPATLWRTTPGQGSWTQVSITLPAVTGLDTAVLAVHGLVAYLAVPAALVHADPVSVLEVTVDGHQWDARPDPCAAEQGETLTGVAAISDTRVALLCQGNIGFGKAEKRVLRSNDTGETTRPGGTLSIWGIVSQLASAPNGTLVVTSFSIGSWIYRNPGGQTWTTSEDLGDGGIGWNDVAFTTNKVAFVIHGPASCCGGGFGELWTTEDGGVTWAPV